MDARTLRETIDDVRHLLRETTTGDELLSRAADVRARLRAALESVQAGTVDPATAAGGFQRSVREELADAASRFRPRSDRLATLGQRARGAAPADRAVLARARGGAQAPHRPRPV